MPSLSNHPRFLLVEGQDDKHVVWQLLKACDLNIDIEVREADGAPQLLAAIPVELDAPERQVLGIVMDADCDPQARWGEVAASLRDSSKFQDAGGDPPAEAKPTGTILEGSPRCPHVGVWLMPDNVNPGELENFIGPMIYGDDPVRPKADDYIDDLPEPHKFDPHRTAKDTAHDHPHKIDKAKVHAWLATRKDPGRMGAAIGAGDLDVGAESCQAFVKWLEELFT